MSSLKIPLLALLDWWPGEKGQLITIDEKAASQYPGRFFRKKKVSKITLFTYRTIGKFTQKIIFYQEMDKDGDVKIRTSKLKDLLSSTSLPLKEVNLFSFVNTNYEGVHETAAIVPKPRARCYLLLLGTLYKFIQNIAVRKCYQIFLRKNIKNISFWF